MDAKENGTIKAYKADTFYTLRNGEFTEVDP